MSSDVDAQYLETSYAGSRFFQPLGDLIGLQIDRVAFLINSLFNMIIMTLFSFSPVKLPVDSIDCSGLCILIPKNLNLPLVKL